MDKLFTIDYKNDKVKLSLLDGNTVFVMPYGLWMNEFMRVYYQVVINDQYEANRIRKGDIVIDCGAHVGMFSMIAAQRGATVFSVEPLLSNAACIEAMLLHGKYDISIVPCVVSNPETMAQGTVTIEYNLNEYSGEGCVVYDRAPNDDMQTAEAMVYTIDFIANRFHLPTVNFIKMDIEGSEVQALEGAETVIKRFKPKLAIAVYHHSDDAYNITELVKSYREDYNISIISKDGFTEPVLIAN